MQLLFVLSKEDISLAAAEVLRLYQPETHRQDQHYLTCSTNKKLHERLAYTQEVHKILIATKSNNLQQEIETNNWSFLSQKTFAVRSYCNVDEKHIANILWKKIKNPLVNLKHPEIFIGVFSVDNKILLTKKIWENKKDFLQRKAHLKPALHPSSLDPRLARAMINLTGKTRGIIVDPFCGSGGILIEALFLGFNVVGIDNNKAMLERAEKNIRHYHFSKKKYQLIFQDALACQQKCAAVVTDLPYGKNTKTVDHERLYSNFLQHYTSLTKTMVVGFPDFINANKLIKKTDWCMKQQFTYYLHKSLSKKIYVLERIR